MKNALALASALAVLAACSRPQPPRHGLSHALSDTLDNAAAGPCSVMPVEWAKSWPVPLPDGSLKVLFYPETGTPDTGPTIYSPGGEGVVSPKLDRFLSCAKLKPAPERLGDQSRPAGERGGMSAYEQRQAELLDDTETVARLYGAGRPPAAEEAQVLKRYVGEFRDLAEPGLLPFYYRANPAFWEWLRAAAGESIPKP